MTDTNQYRNFRRPGRARTVLAGALLALLVLFACESQRGGPRTVTYDPGATPAPTSEWRIQK